MPKRKLGEERCNVLSISSCSLSLTSPLPFWHSLILEGQIKSNEYPAKVCTTQNIYHTLPVKKGFGTCHMLCRVYYLEQKNIPRRQQATILYKCNISEILVHMIEMAIFSLSIFNKNYLIRHWNIQFVLSKILLNWIQQMLRFKCLKRIHGELHV